MPKRSNLFQHLIATIEKVTASQDVKVQESALVPLRKGTGTREVDVLIEGAVGGHRVRVAVECRDHERTQDVTWIDELRGKFADLAIDKIVAVSRSGFTGPAEKLAASAGIDTYTVVDALGLDWGERLRRYQIEAMRRRILQANVRLKVRMPTELVGTIDPRQVKIVDRAGNPVGNMQDVVDKLVESEAKPRASEQLWSEREKIGPDAKTVTLSIPVDIEGMEGRAPDGRPIYLSNAICDVTISVAFPDVQHQYGEYSNVGVVIGKIAEADGTEVSAGALILHESPEPRAHIIGAESKTKRKASA